MTQEQIHHHTPERAKEKTAETPAEIPSKDVDAERLKADLDSVLDEIDEVLEANAEEFVRGYVQKGGE